MPRSRSRGAAPVETPPVDKRVTRGSTRRSSPVASPAKTAKESPAASKRIASPSPKKAAA